jgi:alcohol dehydrogenase class IV
VVELLPFELQHVPRADSTMIVVGGGALMDQWKYRKVAEGFRLICIPSTFASGAEVSSVIVINTTDGKQIEMDDAYKPDARAYLPELLQGLDAARVRDACGDVWSHVIEAFISPLATDAVRIELAVLMNEMFSVPLEADARWFDLGARACDAQLRSSVGLIHGIAHTIEPLLDDSIRFGHAALCAILIAPVLQFNRTHSDKWAELVNQYGLNEADFDRIASSLFDPERYAVVRGLMESHWKTILRDRCSRTNGVLIRPRHLSYFLDTSFA